MLAAAPSAQADPLQDFAQMSSQAQGSWDKAVRDAEIAAYNALPGEARAYVPDPRPKAPAMDTAQKKHKSARPACPNCVALTFDDGPAASTTQLLDILDRHDVNASFFVLAPNASAHPELLRRMEAAGHTIGNHTASHKELNKMDKASVDREIAAGNAAINAAVGHGSRWVRPPYGATNATVAQSTREAGAAQVLWNVDTLDWKTKSPQQTCQTAVNEAQAGGIVLMHDIHPTTVAAVDCVIDGLLAKGLTPVSLDEMILNPQPGRTYTQR